MPELILSFDTKSLWQLKATFREHGVPQDSQPGPLEGSAPYTGHRLVSWNSCANVCMAYHGSIIKGDMLGQSLHQNEEITSFKCAGQDMPWRKALK